MKEFTAKTLEEALELASKDFNIEANKLQYKVLKEEKSIFKNKRSVTIGCYDLQDLFADIKTYLTSIIALYNIEGTFEFTYDPSTEIVKCKIKPTDEEKSKMLIGPQGKTLNDLTTLARAFISKKYNHDYRILLDIGTYKEQKYKRLASIARHLGKNVQRSRVDCVLDPMSSDERRIVHNTLQEMNYVTTVSEGFGDNRHIVIKYDASLVKHETRFNRKHNEEKETVEETEENND